MKFQFESDLEYQLDAVNAVCDLFQGQEKETTEFSITSAPDSVLGTTIAGDDEGFWNLGIGNSLTIQDDQILSNLQAIQVRGSLTSSSTLNSGDFTVEMETGTGKTYVYLRTMFELNRRYGFTKFIIVVPSIAIKEGVYKTLQMTSAHFKNLYGGVRTDYFLYDSTKLGQVRNFATSLQMQIMVVTVGAINKKDVNNLYKDSEKTAGERPIDLIKATRPVVIVDEPQSVDGGLNGAGKTALDAMNPLCTLRYSATHANEHHMVYRLDAIDAYERNLVKQIEVASATIEDAHNKPYVRLISVASRSGSPIARIELDIEASGSVHRREVVVSDGDDLRRISGRSVYEDHQIGEISLLRGEQYLELRVPGSDRYLQTGEAFGDVDPASLQREMIRRTIREHLDKELRLIPQRIKVLSLFFVDSVARYRSYDESGNAVKGEYALMFEQEFTRAAGIPKYKSLFDGKDVDAVAKVAHDGYFSIDRRGGWLDTSESNASNRESAERAYNLIMKDKEELLSLDQPLRFIFSHSALKEGWDNPNVFQICALRNVQSERDRRQTIGRGLRLCVDSGGERVRDSSINTLTVIAGESYEEFATSLQTEIENDTGIRFGVVQAERFVAALSNPFEEDGLTGEERADILVESLMSSGYLNSSAKAQESLEVALAEGSVNLPTQLEPWRGAIEDVLRKLVSKIRVKNADERRTVPVRKSVLLSSEFKALWDRIKFHTTYRVSFDDAKLVEECAKAIRVAPLITRARLEWRKAGISIGRQGVKASELPGASSVALDEQVTDLPDLISDLQEKTQLTRRSIVEILIASGRLAEFATNPQQFVEECAHIISATKQLMLVDGIKYQEVGSDHFYAQELFEAKELTGYLKNMLPDASKSLFESVIFDSAVERNFAKGLELSEAVKLYVKLPGWFTVPTPLGSYNPDWAILLDRDGIESLYFVVETKSSLLAADLRDRERAKIQCGSAHFDALGSSGTRARFVVATQLSDVFAAIP